MSKSAFLSVTANTCVRDFGQYVTSFELRFAPGTDLSEANPDHFRFTGTSKHPSAVHESFGVLRTRRAGETLELSVDPFLFDEKFGAEFVLGGETFRFSKADVGKMNVEVVDDFEILRTERGMTYRLLVPESDGPLPLVVAFHGSGERGTDGYRHMVSFRMVTKWGEPESQAKYPCIVLGPQMTEDWSDAELEDVRGIIDRLISEGKADPKRIYAAGLAAYQSTLRFAAANTDLLAGVIAMLFWEKYTPDLSPLADLPIWMCIGENDFTGESPYLRNAYRYLTETLHNKNARCTVFTQEEMMSWGLYGRLSHCGWIPTLNSPQICDWLFAQRRE